MRKFLSNIVRSVVEVTLPLWSRCLARNRHAALSGKEGGVVVSLTTFPGRIGELWIVLESLFRQTTPPDKIILSLTESEFPGGIDDLPESVKEYLPLGVEAVFLPFNYKCHNKYLHSLKEYGSSVVITVDDDCYYRKDTIERLLKLHSKNPGAVCCNIAAVIDTEHFHEYSFWKKSVRALPPDNRNVALGFAGVLYPAGMPEAVLDTELSQKLAPYADDLWLKAVELVNGIKVTCGSFFPKPVTIKSSQKISLRSRNKGTENRNDVQWKALDEYFGLKEKI